MPLKKLSSQHAKLCSETEHYQNTTLPGNILGTHHLVIHEARSGDVNAIDERSATDWRRWYHGESKVLRKKMPRTPGDIFDVSPKYTRD